MRRVGLFLALGAVLLVVIGFGFKYAVNTPEKPSSSSFAMNEFQNSTQGIKFSYPADANQLKLSTQDIEDKFLFRASRDTKAPYLITLRYEDGLRTASSLAKTNTMDLLLTNTDKALPARYPEFKKLSERRFEQDGAQLARITFTYTRPQDEIVQQDLYIFLEDENKAFYLSLQAKQADFSDLEQIFKSVAESLQLL